MMGTYGLQYRRGQALEPQKFFAKNELGKHRPKERHQSGRSEGQEAVAEVLELLLTEDITGTDVGVGDAAMEADVSAPEVAIPEDIEGSPPTDRIMLYLPERNRNRLGGFTDVRVGCTGLQMGETMGFVVRQPDLEGWQRK